VELGSLRFSRRGIAVEHEPVSTSSLNTLTSTAMQGTSGTDGRLYSVTYAPSRNACPAKPPLEPCWKSAAAREIARLATANRTLKGCRSATGR
jgi:hypothetical protein